MPRARVRAWGLSNGLRADGCAVREKCATGLDRSVESCSSATKMPRKLPKPHTQTGRVSHLDSFSFLLPRPPARPPAFGIIWQWLLRSTRQRPYRGLRLRLVRLFGLVWLIPLWLLRVSIIVSTLVPITRARS